MRMIVITTVLVFCSACADYNTFPREDAKGLDNAAVLKTLIDKGQTVEDGEYRIVDVRPENQYAKGHIPTAMNLPDGTMNGHVETPPEDKLIIVYCETGDRAQMAALKLAAAGFNTVYNWGGFENWTFPPAK